MRAAEVRRRRPLGQRATPEAVGANSRWSRASRDTAVIAKNVAARTPPDPRANENRTPAGVLETHEPGSTNSRSPIPPGWNVRGTSDPVVFAPPRFLR